ncbi:MAG TPA: hypothetical protein VF712_07480 [Thermoleophilaceae bacterium]
MNAVNLLPAKHRPRTPTGGQQGSSYVVIGVLGAALLMVLMYAVTVNGINTKKASVASMKAETVQAKKRSDELAPYGNFTQVKQQRVDSVKSIAIGRLDWERLARGLGAVLPEDVWLTKASASATGAPGGGGAPAAAAPPAQSAPAPGGAKAPAPTSSDDDAPVQEPKMILNGCALNHSVLAVTLVRLRHLPAVTDVALVSASKPVDRPAVPGTPGAPAGPSAPGAPAAGSGAAGSDDCGSIRKHPALTFEATVTFKPQSGSELEQSTGEKDRVPTTLGGGA